MKARWMSLTFSEDFQRYTKLSEDFQRRFKDVLTNLSAVKWTKNVIKNDILTCVDNNDILTCGVSFLSICYHSVFHCLLYNKINYTVTIQNKWCLMLCEGVKALFNKLL